MKIKNIARFQWLGLERAMELAAAPLEASTPPPSPVRKKFRLLAEEIWQNYL